MSEDTLYSEEAKLARKLNYQVEIDATRLEPNFHDLCPEDEEDDEMSDKGTTNIDGERAKWTRYVHHRAFHLCERVSLKGWRQRKDAGLIRLAICEALWERMKQDAEQDRAEYEADRSRNTKPTGQAL